MHHVAANAQWQALANSGFEYRDTEIARVTGGIGSVRIFRCIVPSANASAPARMPIDDGEFVFLYVLDGYLNLSSEATGTQALSVDDACVIASAADFFMSATSPCTVLQVALPGR